MSTDVVTFSLSYFDIQSILGWWFEEKPRRTVKQGTAHLQGLLGRELREMEVRLVRHLHEAVKTTLGGKR